MFYIRYRHGFLSLRVSEGPTDDVMDAVGGPELLGEDPDIVSDGFMTDEEMMLFTKRHIAWGAVEQHLNSNESI